MAQSCDFDSQQLEVQQSVEFLDSFISTESFPAK